MSTTDEASTERFPSFPLDWIDTGEIVDANLEHVLLCEDEELGTLFAAADDLLQASRNARIILQSFRYAGEGGLDSMIAELDAAIAKAEGR